MGNTAVVVDQTVMMGKPILVRLGADGTIEPLRSAHPWLATEPALATLEVLQRSTTTPATTLAGWTPARRVVNFAGLAPNQKGVARRIS